VSGKVAAGNDALADSPELVNQDPYGDGWIMRVEADDPAELETLMDAATYEATLED
jgi:glycine cleavage system H protein